MPRGVRTPKSQVRGQTYTRLLEGITAAAETEIDAVSQIIVPVDSFLIGIQGYVRLEGNTDNDEGRMEISTSGNYQGEDNDNADTLFVLANWTQVTTTGMSNGVTSGSIQGLKIPFAAGERIYLNVGKTASDSVQGAVVLHFERR